MFAKMRHMVRAHLARFTAWHRRAITDCGEPKPYPETLGRSLGKANFQITFY